MDGKQKEEVRRAVEKLGTVVKDDNGKNVAKLSKEMLGDQLIPKNALGMSDQMVEGLYSQAYRLYNTGKYKDACQLFRLLIMIDSREPKYTMGLAACFHMLKEYQNAVSTYSLCGVVDPNNPIPHYHAADCYIKLGDKVSAMISLEMAVKRAGDNPAFQSIKDRSQITIESLKKDIKEALGDNVANELQEKINKNKKS